MNAHQRRVRQRTFKHFVNREVTCKLPSGIVKKGRVRKVDGSRMSTPVGVDFDGAKRLAWVNPAFLSFA